MKTQNITRIGMLISLALILSYIEYLIPIYITVPGIKVGLANIVVIFALYKMGFKQAFAISISRIFLSTLLFGSILSLAYSFSGAILSLIGMFLLKKTKLFETVGVSVVGGVLHNLGQIFTACLLLRTNSIMYYMPVLIIGGTISGILIGLAGAILIKRIDFEN